MMEPDWGDRLRQKMAEEYDQHDDVTPATGFIDSDGRGIQMGPGDRYEDHRALVPTVEEMRKYGWPEDVIRHAEEHTRTPGMYEAMKRSRLVRFHLGEGYMRVEWKHDRLTSRQRQAIKDAALTYRPKTVELYGPNDEPEESGWEDLRLSRSEPKVDWNVMDNDGLRTKESIKKNHNVAHSRIFKQSVPLEHLYPVIVERENARQVRGMSPETLEREYGETDMSPYDYAQQMEDEWEERKRSEYARPFGRGYPPILVRRVGESEYEILDGNHRVETWQDQGYESAPAWVIDDWGHKNKVRLSRDEGPEGWITPEGVFHQNDMSLPFGSRHEATLMAHDLKHGEAVRLGWMHVGSPDDVQVLGHHPDLAYTAPQLRTLKKLAAKSNRTPAITSKSNGVYTTRELKLSREFDELDGWVSPEGEWLPNGETTHVRAAERLLRSRHGVKAITQSPEHEAYDRGYMHVANGGDGALYGHHPKRDYTAAQLRKLKQLAVEGSLSRAAITSFRNGRLDTRELKLAREDIAALKGLVAQAPSDPQAHLMLAEALEAHGHPRLAGLLMHPGGEWTRYPWSSSYRGGIREYKTGFRKTRGTITHPLIEGVRIYPGGYRGTRHLELLFHHAPGMMYRIRSYPLREYKSAEDEVVNLSRRELSGWVSPTGEFTKNEGEMSHGDTAYILLTQKHGYPEDVRNVEQLLHREGYMHVSDGEDGFLYGHHPDRQYQAPQLTTLKRLARENGFTKAAVTNDVNGCLGTRELKLSMEKPEHLGDPVPEDNRFEESIRFTVPGSGTYDVALSKPSPGSKKRDLVFDRVDRDGPPPQNPTKVFAHVAHGALQLLRKHNRHPVVIEAGSPGLAKLYERLMDRLPDHLPGWAVSRGMDEGGGYGIWHLTPPSLKLGALRRMEGYNGWVDPEGQFYLNPENGTADHEFGARRIVPHGQDLPWASDHLESKGWMKVWAWKHLPELLYGHHPKYQYTSAQVSALKRLARKGGFTTVSITTKVNGSPGTRELKLARQKAPAGGMIVNNQFFKGGKFLPRALESIRKMRGHITLAREFPEGIESLLERAPTDAFAHGALVDLLDEAGHSTLAGLLRKGSWTKYPSYLTPPVYVGGPGRIAESDPTKFHGYRSRDFHHPLLYMVQAKRGRDRGLRNLRLYFKTPRDVYFDIPDVRVKEITEMKKEQLGLARVPLPEGAFGQKTLTDAQIRDIENHHGLEEHERLPRTVDPDGTVSTSIEHLAPFFDRLAKKAIGPERHAAILADDGVSDDVKFYHLLTHAHDSANDYLSAVARSGTEWYGSSVAQLDRGLKVIFGRERPGDPNSKPDPKKWTPAHAKLFKMLLALTSYNTAPINNTKNAIAALLAGYRHGPHAPFENIPDANHESLAPYKDLPPPGTSIAGRLKWQEKYGDKNPGYMSAPVRLANGKVVGLVNMDATVRWIVPGFDKANTKPGLIPITDENGNLRPKTWGSMGVDRVRKFKEFISRAGSYQKAARILEREWTPAQLKALFNLKAINRGDLEPGAKIPGSFAFGPKFGAFFQNLRGEKSRITMDKWYSRTMARLVGNLIGNGKLVEIPDGPRTRRLWKRVGEAVAKRLGISPADMQAVLWYYEQNLWRLFGAKNRSEDFADGIRETLKHHGFTK